jgi:very-short-patch-repair endonuclease
MRATQKYKSLPYNPALKERAKALRKAGILHEVLLWMQLKGNQLNGLDFDRQKIIGNYIVDFYCAEKGVVIEADGSSHDTKQPQDAERDRFLQGLGLVVIRLLVKDVLHCMEEVITFLRNHPALAGTPPVEGNLFASADHPALAGTPPEEGNVLDSTLHNSPLEEGNVRSSTPNNSPPKEGCQALPDGVVLPNEKNEKLGTQNA